MDVKQLNKAIRSVNKAVKAIEDHSLHLCELSNRLVEHVEFLEAEIELLKEAGNGKANSDS